ncbi:hypothetical protein XA68_15362 [Ophiocordyceps unilateralis]|uniref:Amidoligase enzyme n=1 Tax=Ophiocordyceps unilateralis TaxID=268505 RepID=A0A2A9PL05_OPHUN|nr:hypothetical protein XA68_15362 [Ophiocordyceps unilateralis]
MALPNLQFGLEFEFVAPPFAEIVMFKERQTMAVNQNIRREGCFYHLAMKLQENGLPAAMDMIVDESECQENPYRNKAPAGSLVGEDLRVMDPATIPDKDDPVQIHFHYWMFKPECDLTEEKMYDIWSQMELNTPILPETEAIAGFPRVDKALELIAQAHDSGVHINHKCGLHVQISPVSGLEVEQARKVVTIVYLVEHSLLFQLCHPSRRHRHQPISRSRFATLDRGFPPSRNEILDIELRNWMPLTFLNVHGNRLRNAWGANDAMEDIRSSLIIRGSKRGDPCSAFNITRHGHGHDRSTYTLQFRHAQSSFKRDFVANWTRLLLTIAKIGCLPAPEFKAVVELLWEVVKVNPRPKDCWRHLLRILAGAPGGEQLMLDEAFWDGRLRDYEKGYPDVVEGKAALCG